MRINYGLVAFLLVSMIFPAVFIVVASLKQDKSTSRGPCSGYEEEKK